MTHRDQDQLREAHEALVAALAAEDRTERMLRIVAAVQHALTDTGSRPVTGHLDVARQAVALIMHPRLDRERLHERAGACGHAAAVTAIERLAARASRGERFDTDELHELARNLRAEIRRP